MSDNCPNSMEENKEEESKKEDLRPHFVSTTNPKEEPWKTNICIPINI